MALVLVIFGFLVVLGRLMGVPGRLQGALIAALFAVVVGAQLVLPPGHPVREATGGSPRIWLIFLVIAVLLWGYIGVLGFLRNKAALTMTHSPSGPFSEAELQRYARHIVLREIGGAGQQKLKAARVLVVGAGGLGAPVLMYLAAAGIGRIGVIDDDTVSLSNLQRQVLFNQSDLGRLKTKAAQENLATLNPHIEVVPFPKRLDAENAAEVFTGFDLILDGSDNFETRYLVNQTCVDLGIPLVSGAISQWEGQVSLFHPAKDGPCYACVFPAAPADGLAPSCAEAGVMGALPGVIGSMMAVEAIKWLTGAGQPLMGQMLIYDALYSENRKMTIVRRETCDVCGGHRHPDPSSD